MIKLPYSILKLEEKMDKIKDFYNKNKIISIGVIGIILIILGFYIFNKSSQSNFFEEAKVEFSGFNKRGSATLTEKSNLAVWKKIANYEGKQAKVDSSTMKTLIKKAEYLSDLTDNDNFNSLSMNSSELMNVKSYIEHMNNTSVSFNHSDSLKNGQKIQLLISDSSEKPFFEKQSKKYTVSGLKKPRTISVSTIIKNIKVKSKGTNTHGYTDIIYPKGLVPGLSSVNWNDIFNNDPGSKIGTKNGDTFTISETKLAEELNHFKDNYKFTGRKVKNVTLTVEGLKSNIGNASNLNSVIEKFKKDNWFDSFNRSVVELYLNQNTDRLYFIFKDNNNGKYSIVSYSNIFLKNNNLMIQNTGMRLQSTPEFENLETHDLLESSVNSYNDVKEIHEISMDKGDILDFPVN